MVKNMKCIEEFETLLNEVDIVEYISQYVDLEERNGEYWGLSPFTDEKTPSFSVNKEKQNFFCFSSGIGGSVLTFIRKYFGVTLWRAVEILKQYAGFSGTLICTKRLDAVKVSKRYKRNKKEIKKIEKPPLNCMEKFIVDYNKTQIWEDEGISRESLRKYEVKYDPLTNRIVYPIKDINGKIVNVGARTLNQRYKELGIRKYSYLYKWGTIDILYGLNESLLYAKESKELIIFEGAKSVMKCDTWGIKNCCALLTSHLGTNQIGILLKVCVENNIKVIFALDKGVRINQDPNIKKLKNFLNIYYIWDYRDLTYDKESPVDQGKEVFEKLYSERLKL